MNHHQRVIIGMLVVIILLRTVDTGYLPNAYNTIINNVSKP